MSKQVAPTKRDRQGARLLALFIDSGDVPDFITDAAAVAVYEAEAATGIDIGVMREEGISIRALSRLIAATRDGRDTRDAETLTAARLADLIGARETPPVLRRLLALVCHTLDAHTYVRSDAADNTTAEGCKFGEDGEASAETIRRELPAMLRKLRDWRPEADTALIVLDAPDGEGGEA